VRSVVGPLLSGNPEAEAMPAELRGSLEATVRTGLGQTRAYMDRCAADAGHLVMFDRAGGKSWDQKMCRREEDTGGARITIWGM